jgi:hypothetical protein
MTLTKLGKRWDTIDGGEVDETYTVKAVSGYVHIQIGKHILILSNLESLKLADQIVKLNKK